MRKNLRGPMVTPRGPAAWATRRCQRREMRRGGEVRARYRIAPASGPAALPGELNSLTVASSEEVRDDVGRTGARPASSRLTIRRRLRRDSLGAERGGEALNGEDAVRGEGGRGGFLPTWRIGGRVQQLVGVGRSRSRTLSNPPAVEAQVGWVARRPKPSSGHTGQCAGNCVTAVDRARSRPMWGRAGSSASRRSPAASGSHPRIRVRLCRWESRFR
jgi:hypothetical protein